MKPPKRENIAEDVAERVRNENYRLSDHADEKMLERGVILPEVREVLLSGLHAPEHDEWDVDHDSWNYAIEGRTHEDRLLRVAVTFVERDDALVVTVITPDE